MKIMNKSCESPLKTVRPTGCPASGPVGRRTSLESSSFTCLRKRCVRSPDYCWRP